MTYFLTCEHTVEPFIPTWNDFIDFPKPTVYLSGDLGALVEHDERPVEDLRRVDHLLRSF